MPFGPGNVMLTSPFLLTESLALLSLFSAFAVAIFASNAVLRDSEFTMEEIVFTTPIGRAEYVVSRFTGAFAAAVTAMAFAIPGMMLATRMPWVDATRVGSLTPLPYLQAFVLFAVPNILFITAILFFVAVLTRSAVATYVASALLYFLYFAASALTNSPLMAGSRPGAGEGRWVALVDPFGLSAFFEQTRLWTIAQKNAEYVSFSGTLLGNRLLWLALAVVLIRWSAGVSPAEPARVSRAPRERRRDAAGTSGRDARGPFGSQLRIEVSLLFRSWPFILLIAAWTILSITEVASSITAAEYGSLFYPTTALATSALQQPLSIMGVLLLVWFGAEIFWREQRFRFAGVAETTPLHGAEIVGAKCAALAMLVLSLIAGSVVAGVIVQSTHGWTHFEPRLYLAFAYFAGARLILYAIAFALIHALSPGRHVGMVATLLFAIAIRMWRFGTAPLPAYSELNGFDRSLIAFNWFTLLWTLVAIAAFVLAARMWRRSGRSIRERLAIAIRSRALALLLLPIAACGGWVYYNTNVLNHVETEAQVNDWKASYERTYQSYANTPQPRVAEVDAHFDLEPEAQRVRAFGTLRLVNRASAPIPMVLVSIRRDAREVKLALDNATLANADENFGMYRFALAQPLAVGASTTLHYDLTLAHRGFEDGAGDTSVVPNGTQLMSFRIMPSLGYRAGYELRDPRERARRNLPPLDVVSDDDEDIATDWVKLTTTISTSPDQIALSGGDLQREWRANGRRYFRYGFDRLVLNRFAIASARYKTERCSDSRVTVFYHPEHQVNVARMCDGASTSLELFTRRFGPYPDRELRIAEAPAHVPFAGYATAGLIFLNENRSFLVDARDPARVDLVTRRVAHEVAHQWWGYQLDAGSTRGSAAIVESLTKYAELMVIEQKYGRDAAAQLLAFENDRYVAGRASETDQEVPLVDVAGQQYVYYGKGAVVMNGIRALAGDDALFTALRHFLESHAGPGHVATARELANTLRATVAPNDRQLVDEWMRDIIVYDFAIGSANATRRADGNYEVRVVVDATKRRSTGRGAETPLHFRERIPVALDDNAPVVFELHDGRNEVVLSAPKLPRVAIVDPYVTRIDTARTNNERAISVR